MKIAYPHLGGLQITFNTTEDCNLRCKYCYEINKSKRDLPLDYAKRFIDLILQDDNPVGVDDVEDRLYKDGIILDFIGDSFMNPTLLDEILTYYQVKVFSSDIPHISFRDKWTGSVSTNGTLFTPQVKSLLEKWKGKLVPGISIDGCPEIHDLNRVYPNGRGSMSEILKNWDWFKSTYPSQVSAVTKSTLSKQSIPYLFNSLKYMHEFLGLCDIHQNFIMENTFCTEQDYKLLVSELSKCVEYVLQHRNSLYYSLIDKFQFAEHKRSSGKHWNCEGHCGSGSMPCLGINGKIYPCFRWAPHTQSKENPEPIVVGDIWKGLYNKDGFRQVREGAYRCNCTKETKCRTCPYESACSYCIGGCYAEFQEFKRTTYICEITKIQCEYAKRYWNEYNKLEKVLDKDGHIEYYPIDHHYDIDKYYYDPNHVYSPE